MQSGKFYDPTGKNFKPGTIWYSSTGSRAIIISVRRYPDAGFDVSDYAVTYEIDNGSQYEQDAWMFQCRYTLTEVKRRL